VIIRARIPKIPSYVIASYANANHATAEEPLAPEEGLCCIEVADINAHNRMVGIPIEPLDKIMPLAKPS